MSELLDMLPEKFFKPLAGKNRQVYFDCADLLMRMDESGEFGPRMLERDAIKILEDHFMNIDIQEDDDAQIRPYQSPRANARCVLNYFRDCGWISGKELDKNGDNLASVTIQCRDVLRFIKKMGEPTQKDQTTNQILSMREMVNTYLNHDLVPNDRREKPYENFLLPMIDDMNSIRVSMQALRDDIHKEAQEILRTKTPDELWHSIDSDAFTKSFFPGYYKLKQNGHISTYLGQISKGLQKIEYDEPLDNMADGCMKYEQIHEYQEAEYKVTDQLGRLRSFIEDEYEDEMHEIETELNASREQAASKLTILLKAGGHDMAQILNDLLLKLGQMDEDRQNEIFERIDRAYQEQDFRYVDEKTFELPPKAIKSQPQPMEAEPDDGPFKSVCDKTQYDTRHVRRYIRNMMGDKESISVQDGIIHDRKDATMVLLALSMTEEPGFPYDVEVGRETVQTEAGQISNIRIIKRNDDKKEGEI